MKIEIGHIKLKEENEVSNLGRKAFSDLKVYLLLLYFYKTR